jgi:thiamine-phosphate pyrophosphorylase
MPANARSGAESGEIILPDKLARARLARAAERFQRRGLPALVLMTDDERLADPLAAARALPRGSLVILRARDDARRAKLAAVLATIARMRGLLLLIANDARLAASIGAHGLHLSEAQARDAFRWRARHPDWLITAAAHSLRACARAHDADALLLAPIFATQSHPGGSALGVMRARFIAQQSLLPVYALGGIDAQTAARLQGGAFVGVAGIGALALTVGC